MDRAAFRAVTLRLGIKALLLEEIFARDSESHRYGEEILDQMRDTYAHVRNRTNPVISLTVIKTPSEERRCVQS